MDLFSYFFSTFNKKRTPIFLPILFFRLFSVYIVRTSFVPDEYWQSVEVAHELTFGYGYLTWEWKKQIRPSVYPFMLSILYSILPQSKFLIVHSPRIFQAILSAIGEYFTFKLALKLYGHSCGHWTLFNTYSSWFLFYCSPRTITNMAETTFTVCGLYLYPWKIRKSKVQNRSNYNYFWLAACSTLMRPTGAVLWIFLWIYHIWREENIYHFIKSTILTGFFSIGFLLICDRWCYGQWVLTLYNFFIFNWSKDIGAFYGSHNFFWYLMVGFPVILSTLVIPLILGITIQKLRTLYVLVLCFILIFSIPSHKEFRFLLPIMPICLIISSQVMVEISQGKCIIFNKRINKKLNSCIAAAIILINVPLAIYMSLYHQRGTVDVMLHISRVVKDDSSVLFLMPCHSTPFYSYIHRNISMKFLTCEPNFDRLENYSDEADVFYDNPMEWLISKFEGKNNVSFPSHIVMFDSLFHSVKTFLEKYNYYVCYETFYSHIFESRKGKYVHVYCKT